MDGVTVFISGPLPSIVGSLELALGRRDGVRVVGTCLAIDETVDTVRRREPGVAVLCADDPHWDGVTACADIKRLRPPTRVMVVGAEGDEQTLLRSVKAGADGFVTDADPLDEVVAAIRQVARGESRVPPEMLGALLRGLIEFRREDDEAVERYASLARREREVLAGIVAGLDNRAIASSLHLSPHTARTHTQNVLAKLGIHSRLEAARFVLEHDLLNRFGTEPADACEPTAELR